MHDRGLSQYTLVFVALRPESIHLHTRTQHAITNQYANVCNIQSQRNKNFKLTVIVITYGELRLQWCKLVSEHLSSLALFRAGSIKLIDFEYAGVNNLAFDIGNFFNEFAGKEYPYRNMCVVMTVFVRSRRH